jgi:hypothetical protein
VAGLGKVAVVGAGSVGAAVAYASLIDGLADDGSAPIGPREWLMTTTLAVVIFLLSEAAKAVSRARTRTGTTARQPADA